MNILNDKHFREKAEHLDGVPLICCRPWTAQYGQTGSVFRFQPDCPFPFYLVFDDGYESWYGYNEILVPST